MWGAIILATVVTGGVLFVWGSGKTASYAENENGALLQAIGIILGVVGVLAALIRTLF